MSHGDVLGRSGSDLDLGGLQEMLLGRDSTCVHQVNIHIAEKQGNSV